MADEITEHRRTYLLRLVVESGGRMPETTLLAAAVHVWPIGRDDLRADVGYLIKVGCLTRDWIAAATPFAALTASERGEDAACGRIKIEGVHKSLWTAS